MTLYVTKTIISIVIFFYIIPITSFIKLGSIWHCELVLCGKYMIRNNEHLGMKKNFWSPRKFFSILIVFLSNIYNNQHETT